MKKGKPGRPKSANPRNEQIIVRVTPEEKTTIEAMAYRSNKTVSECIRFCFGCVS